LTRADFERLEGEDAQFSGVELDDTLHHRGSRISSISKEPAKLASKF